MLDVLHQHLRLRPTRRRPLELADLAEQHLDHMVFLDALVDDLGDLLGQVSGPGVEHRLLDVGVDLEPRSISCMSVVIVPTSPASSAVVNRAKRPRTRL